MELGNLIFGNSRGEYPLDRDLYEGIVVRGLSDIGCDHYGHLNDKTLEAYRNDRGGITTSMFEIYPYWWGDEDDEAADTPNFKHIPTGFEIDWYKYSLRDSYANQDLDPNQVADIFCECAKFARELRKEEISGEGWSVENEKLDECDVMTDNGSGKAIRKGSSLRDEDGFDYEDPRWVAYVSDSDGAYLKVGEDTGYEDRKDAIMAILKTLRKE